jgi:ATP-dependent DNA ligase
VVEYDSAVGLDCLAELDPVNVGDERFQLSAPDLQRHPAPSACRFVHPARPLLTSTPRSGPEWAHEIKHDGYRLIAIKDADRVVLWSRYATDYSDTFVRIAEAVRAPCPSTTL